MALTVEIKHPEYEDDVLFDVAGVAVPNGGKVQLSEVQERELCARRQKPAKEVFEGNQFIKVSGTPILSAKDLESIIVESNFGPVPETGEQSATAATIETPATSGTEGSDG